MRDEWEGVMVPRHNHGSANPVAWRRVEPVDRETYAAHSMESRYLDKRVVRGDWEGNRERLGLRIWDVLQRVCLDLSGRRNGQMRALARVDNIIDNALRQHVFNKTICHWAAPSFSLSSSWNMDGARRQNESSIGEFIRYTSGPLSGRCVRYALITTKLVPAHPQRSCTDQSFRSIKSLILVESSCQSHPCRRCQ